MYMLDTNICIYVLKNRSDQLQHKFNAIKDICISSVTYGEFCYGIENGDSHLKKERGQQLKAFTPRLLLDSWDAEAGKHYGAIRAQLKTEGKLIGNNDLFIAAHARSINAVLVTNNAREFNRVSDLTIENWVSD
jgi:tRNA(fMet)-specific endonuclease VapC